MPDAAAYANAGNINAVAIITRVDCVIELGIELNIELRIEDTAALEKQNNRAILFIYFQNF